MHPRREVFFLGTTGGQRFAVVNRPRNIPVGGILYLHPFAEEMNRSRRMAAIAARAFAEQGWLVLQMDLLGCGDSSGDFGDVRWYNWLEDVALGVRWLEDNAGDVPIALWTLRAGSLLAADWLHHADRQFPLLLWQPVLNGRQCLTQFLRIKAAAQMPGEVDTRKVMAELRAELDAGNAVEVAGYHLSSELAVGLNAATLRLAPGYSAPVTVFEVVSREPATPSSALETLVANWQQDRTFSSLEVVPGPGFWQTHEVEIVPTLIEHSLRALKGFARCA